MDITVRGGMREGERGGYGSSTLGEGEEVLGVVCNDHHSLAERFFTVGGAYEALEINTKREIDMGTRLALKMHERGKGAVKPRRHIFVPKVGTEERTMEFLKMYAGGRISSSRLGVGGEQ